MGAGARGAIRAIHLEDAVVDGQRSIQRVDAPALGIVGGTGAATTHGLIALKRHVGERDEAAIVQNAAAPRLRAAGYCPCPAIVLSEAVLDNEVLEGDGDAVGACRLADLEDAVEDLCLIDGNGGCGFAAG